MPIAITQGATTVRFAYDTDHRRMGRTTSVRQWYYFDAFGVHAEAFFSSTVS